MFKNNLFKNFEIALTSNRKIIKILSQVTHFIYKNIDRKLEKTLVLPTENIFCIE